MRIGPFRLKILSIYKIPFVSSEVETPIGYALPLGLSTSLETNG